MEAEKATYDWTVKHILNLTVCWIQDGVRDFAAERGWAEMAPLSFVPTLPKLKCVKKNGMATTQAAS